MNIRPEFTTLRSYAAIVEDGLILLCRLGPQSNNPGMWTLPGGGGNYGESPEETCHREVMEETGLRVRLSPFPLVNSVLFENQLSRVHSVRFIYRAAQTGGELRHEVSGSTDLAEWVPLQKVTARPRADIVNLTLEMLKP